jgi:hypothetical protein
MAAPRRAATDDNVFDAPIATIVILVIIIAGAIDVLLDGHLSGDFQVYVKTIALPVAGLALGRGWAARKAG